jgi:putative transcriptional regulator
MRKRVVVCHLKEILFRRTGNCNLTGLARECGVSRVTVDRLANNKNVKGVEFTTITALCGYLQCDIGELFTVEMEGDA